MAALIEAATPADFPAEIAVVISNRGDAAGLERAKASEIATEVIESKPFGKDRAAFEAALEAKLGQYRIDLSFASAVSCACSPPNSCSAGTDACSTSIPRCCRRFRALIRTARRSLPA